jgi:hypothetical protein
MIAQPTTERLIEVVRQELRDNIAPRMADDGPTTAALQMVDQVLETLARRAAHEIAWMTEEIAELTAIGERAAALLPPGSRTTEAVAALGAADPTSLHLDDVAARYSLASEILACATEEVPAGSELRAAVEAALDTRLLREQDIIGEFQLVGRS